MKIKNWQNDIPYASYTIRFYDWFEKEESQKLLYDKLITRIEQDNLLLNQDINVHYLLLNQMYIAFLGEYSEYEINGETDNEFVRYLYSTYQKWYRYYRQKLDLYMKKPEFDGNYINKSTNQLYDLPHKNESGEVVKGNLTQQIDVNNFNSLNLQALYRDSYDLIEDVIREFVLKFKENFIMIGG